MDAKANTRASVDSNSPLLSKVQDRTPPSSASSSAEKNTASNSSGQDSKAQENGVKGTLNPKHPVSSIPFSMIHW